MVESRQVGRRSLLLVSAALVAASGCRDRPETRQPRPGANSRAPNQVGWQRAPGPASRPAASTSGPSSLPAGGAVTDEDAAEPMRVLARASVGQWARYRLAGGFEQHLEVIETTDRAVHLRLKMWLNGRPAGLPATRVEPTDVDWALRAAERSEARVTTRHTTLTAAGRRWQTRLTIARWRYEGVNYERRTWTAADGPIYGIIRMLMTADDSLAASMALIEFGQSAGQRSP